MATEPVGTTEKPLVAGAIWFNTTNHSIEVYDGAKWTVFSGVLDASIANEKLTIVKHDGSKVEVDFSIYATDEALNLLAGHVTTLEGAVATHGSNIENLQGRMTTVEGKAAANEGKLAGLTETTVMAEIAKQVAAEAEIARKAEGDLVARVEPLETASANYKTRIETLEGKFTGEDSVANQIDNAVAAAEGRVDNKLATKADMSVYEAYVAANDAAVAAVKKTAEDEVARAEAAEALIDEKIGVPAGVEGVEAYSEDYTVGQDIKAAKDAAAAAQKTIDDFLVGEGIDPDKVDALREIVKYMEDHGAEYEAVVENLETLNTDVAALQGKVDVAKVSEAIATAKGEAVTSANGYTDEKIAAEVLRADGKYEEKGVAKGLVDALAERVSDNEAAVATVDSRIATAKSEAIAEATRLDGVLKSELQTYADGKASAAQNAAEAKAAELVNGLANGAVATNTAAIAALDAKVTEGLAWVTFE